MKFKTEHQFISSEVIAYAKNCMQQVNDIIFTVNWTELEPFNEIPHQGMNILDLGLIIVVVVENNVVL